MKATDSISCMEENNWKYPSVYDEVIRVKGLKYMGPLFMHPKWATICSTKTIFKFTSVGEPNVSDIAEPLCAASAARYLLKREDAGRLKRRETSRDIPNILNPEAKWRRWRTTQKPLPDDRMPSPRASVEKIIEILNFEKIKNVWFTSSEWLSANEKWSYSASCPRRGHRASSSVGDETSWTLPPRWEVSGDIT